MTDPVRTPGRSAPGLVQTLLWALVVATASIALAPLGTTALYAVMGAVAVAGIGYALRRDLRGPLMAGSGASSPKSVGHRARPASTSGAVACRRRPARARAGRCPLVGAAAMDRGDARRDRRRSSGARVGRRAARHQGHPRTAGRRHPGRTARAALAARRRPRRRRAGPAGRRPRCVPASRRGQAVGAVGCARRRCRWGGHRLGCGDRRDRGRDRGGRGDRRRRPVPVRTRPDGVLHLRGRVLADVHHAQVVRPQDLEVSVGRSPST